MKRRYSPYMDHLARQVGYPTYAVYLASDYWLEFSKKAKDPCCFCCGGRKRLALHHMSYERLGCELLTDVVTLCEQCHNATHELARAGVELITAHLRHKENLSRSKQFTKSPLPNRPKKAKKNKRKKIPRWVKWAVLVEHTTSKTDDEVVQVLTAEGLLSGARCTPRAVRSKFAKRRMTCEMWSLKKFSKLYQSQKKTLTKGTKR